jgi:hypothetical protein
VRGFPSPCTSSALPAIAAEDVSGLLFLDIATCKLLGHTFASRLDDHRSRSDHDGLFLQADVSTRLLGLHRI